MPVIATLHEGVVEVVLVNEVGRRRLSKEKVETSHSRNRQKEQERIPMTTEVTMVVVHDAVQAGRELGAVDDEVIRKKCLCASSNAKYFLTKLQYILIYNANLEFYRIIVSQIPR